MTKAELESATRAAQVYAELAAMTASGAFKAGSNQTGNEAANRSIGYRHEAEKLESEAKSNG